MLKRKIDKYLLEWKNDENHLPLILTGARQIGKTTSIREFASSNYESVIEINFFEEPKYKSIFNNGYSPKDVIKEISTLNPEFEFIPKKTLIFFDEVQQYMDATTSLKFFAEDGNYDVICSGSALGVAYKEVSSVSVGFKQDKQMYSLDFEEFLWAKGYSDKQIEDLKNNILNLEPYSINIMNTFNKLFFEYILTGGMPKVVNRYIESDNFSGLLDMQKQILKDYDDDITKYVKGLDVAKVRNVYRHIAFQLGKDNHKFQITKLGHGARANQYVGCQEWLSDAGVANVCYCLNDLSLPIKGNENQDNYRLYFADTSLLLASLDEESQDDLRTNKNLGVYKGSMYENFAGEALRKQGYDLYFYKSEDARTELDFVIRVKNNIVPIEIKSNKGTSRSLNAVIEDKNISEITYGIKFSNNNIGYSNNIITLPFFSLFLLKDALKKRDNTKLGQLIEKISNK